MPSDLDGTTVGGRRRYWSSRPIAILATVLVLLCGACGDDERAVAWRDLDLTLPEGWMVINDLQGALYVADGTPGEDPGDPGDQEVGVQFQTDARVVSDDWRELVADGDGTLERDEATTVDGLPATLLEWSYPGSANSPPTREQAVLVPSRDLVILSQAVTVQGQQDGPEVFDAHVEDFDALRESIDFGAPVDFGE